MSRAFHPPDTLSKEDVRTIADVRRDIWTNGFRGIFYGSATGFTLHSLSNLTYNRILSEEQRTRFQKSSLGKALTKDGVQKIRFTRNSAFLSVMLGGALGSFLMATTAGKNEVHNLHDIYKIGEREAGTPYQKAIEKARQEAEKANIEREERIVRERRRLSRRETVVKRLEEGHGLSDSHGGTWAEENDGEGVGVHRKRVMTRRTDMKKRLEEGRGLSDSHGGKWESS